MWKRLSKENMWNNINNRQHLLAICSILGMDLKHFTLFNKFNSHNNPRRNTVTGPILQMKIKAQLSG